MKQAAAKPAVNSYATPALEKGLDVLELLAHQPGGLTKSQIARELGRSVSEIFRMLVCLEDRGYISHVTGDHYALTLKLFQLVQEHPPTQRLIAEALPVMQRFTHDTLQSCHLGVIEDARVVILAQVNAPTAAGFYVKLGSSVDIMDASSGFVILAHQQKASLERTLGEWQRVTQLEPPADLRQHLARIRRKGFEERNSYQVRGVVNMTFPVFDDRGSAIGALTVPYIEYVDPSVTRAAVLEAARAAAAEITRAIGGTAPTAA